MRTSKFAHLALKASAGCILGMFASTTLADPYTLQGVCRITSNISGQGTCQLEFILSDSVTSQDVITKALITVDALLVATYVNDAVTPATFSAGTVSGQTAVTCGTTHAVRA